MQKEKILKNKKEKRKRNKCPKKIIENKEKRRKR
jgi:hypothetical protein